MVERTEEAECEKYGKPTSLGEMYDTSTRATANAERNDMFPVASTCLVSWVLRCYYELAEGWDILLSSYMRFYCVVSDLLI